MIFKKFVIGHIRTHDLRVFEINQKVLTIFVIRWLKSKMQFKFNQQFQPDPLDQMRNGKFDQLELRNFSPLLSKQNLKKDPKMESSLTDFIGEEYDRNVF